MKLTLGRAVTLAILFASLLGLAAGLWLIATYNIGTQYASEVPTATQTVKMCH
ncbi:MAG: hypothetical protein JF615_11045, partial [Asticcacaulis sp.]|nr:hypothetical protein [Asticcacaulis sp.]